MFLGFAEWPSDEPIVECVLDSGRTVDLHNSSDFRRMVFHPTGALRFDFRILHEHIFGPSLQPNDTVSLTFEGVRNLQIQQHPLTRDEDQGLFEHLVFSKENAFVELVFEVLTISFSFATVQAELLVTE